MPCALNAANEIAVGAFLHNRIAFHHIYKIIEKTMQTVDLIRQPTLSDINCTNAQARLVAQNLLTNA